MSPVRIPADIEVPDRVVGRLTARQAVILAGATAVVYAGWRVGHWWMPRLALVVYPMVAIPVLALAAVAAFARRDGLSVDALARAAVLYWWRPGHLTHTRDDGPAPRWASARCSPVPGAGTPPRRGPGRVGVRGILAGPLAEAGLIDLGADGWAVLAATSTVPFALRTPTEQDRLIGYFAAALHAQNGPLQILVRAQRLDLTPVLDELATASTQSRHPALAAAAASHHDWIAALPHREPTSLLTRHVLIVLREPHPPTPWAHPHSPHPPTATTASAAAARLASRLTDLARALALAQITVTPLSPEQINAVLTTTADPARPPYTHRSPHPPR